MKRLLTVPVMLALTGAALAGCLTSADDQVDLPDLDQILRSGIVNVDGHDHADVEAHQQAYNLATLGSTAATSATSAGKPTVYGEVDVRSGIAAVALLHVTDVVSPGFALVDTTDPAAPRVLSVNTAEPFDSVYAADVKLSDDGNWVFLAMQDFSSLPLAKLQQLGVPLSMLPVGLPATPANNVVDAGVLVFDARDKADPQIAGFFPVQPSGVHMMDVQDVGGETYLFLQSMSGAPVSGCFNLPGELPEEVPRCPTAGTPAASLATLTPEVIITDFQVTETGAVTMREVQRYTGTIGHYIHDVTVVRDEVDEKDYMYVAHWYDGIHVVDVSGLPGAIQEVGHWVASDFADPASEQGRVHTVMATWIGDQRIVVGSPEFPFRSSQPPIYVVDFTDPANPVELARWTVPGDGLNFSRQETGLQPLYRFSTHNINFEDGLLYLSHFHGGLWILDFNVDPANPTVVGYTMLEPAVRGPGALGGAIDDAPSVWDAFPADGVVWATDINSGLYAVGIESLPDPVVPASMAVE